MLDVVHMTAIKLRIYQIYHTHSNKLCTYARIKETKSLENGRYEYFRSSIAEPTIILLLLCCHTFSNAIWFKMHVLNRENIFVASKPSFCVVCQKSSENVVKFVFLVLKTSKTSIIQMLSHIFVRYNMWGVYYVCVCVCATGYEISYINTGKIVLICKMIKCGVV